MTKKHNLHSAKSNHLARSTYKVYVVELSRKSVTSPDHHSEYGGLPALSIWRGETESSTAVMAIGGVECAK
jgi:hypothetical protein